MKVLLLLLVSISAYAQEPYRLILATDPETRAKAEEFRLYLLGKAPFNQLGDQIEIIVSEMNDADMNCRNDKQNAPRLISCDESKINERKRSLKGHHIAAFTDNAKGGAGGQIAIASLDYPKSTMLHEMLHMYGLEDEYEYKGSEIEVYCNPPRSGENLAILTPQPPYADKGVALSKHGSKIPWVGQIAASTPLTTGTTTLGTPPDHDDVIGLFEGGNCSKKDSAENVYRPYINSIMKNLDADEIQPLYQQRLLEAMEVARNEKFSNAPIVVAPSSATSSGPTENGELCAPLLGPMTGETSNATSLAEEIDRIYERIRYPRKKQVRIPNGE